MRGPAVQSPVSPVGRAVAAPPDQADREAGGPGAGADGKPEALPGFVWQAQVHFDELDTMGMLHNSRYLVLLERASSAFFEAGGWRWERDPALNPDQHYVVREQTIRYLEPVLGPGPVAVEMWVARLGQTSVTFAFRVRSPDGRKVHATAERVHIKLDPGTFRPARWTPRLRGLLTGLARPGRRPALPGPAAGPPA